MVHKNPELDVRPDMTIQIKTNIVSDYGTFFDEDCARVEVSHGREEGNGTKTHVFVQLPRGFCVEDMHWSDDYISMDLIGTYESQYMADALETVVTALRMRPKACPGCRHWECRCQRVHMS